MNETIIFKPLTKLFFYENASGKLIFEVDCIDGRAKWNKSKNILSIKFQTSNKSKGVGELNKLSIGNEFDIIIENIVGNSKFENNKFENAIINKFELRSISMSIESYELSNRYFIEASIK